MSNTTRKARGNASKAVTGPREDYEVGYRKPPKASRFQPGRSGNPSGRKKPKKSLDESLREALHARAKVMVDGRLVNMTKAEIIWSNLIALAAKGDVKAIRALLAAIKAYPTAAKVPVEPKLIHKGMTALEASEIYARFIRGED